MRLIILVVALTTLTVAQHVIELHPVFSETKLHTGYSMKVKIGTPAKTFSVLLETVTSNFWVVGIDCFDLLFLTPVYATKYSECKSSTQQLVRVPWFQFYGPQRLLSGPYQWKDKVSVDEAEGGALELGTMAFGTVPTLGAIALWRQYQNIDGIFGIGPSSSAFSIIDPIEAIQIALFNQVITIALPAQGCSNRGFLALGEPNGELCDLKTEQEEDVVSANRYDFEVSNIQMGPRILNFDSKTVAYPHTSKPYIGVPKQFMKQIVQDLKAKKNAITGKYMVDCDKEYEPFVLKTAEHVYVLPPQHFIIKHNEEDDQCELAFETRPGLRSAITLGLPFLHHFCTILQPSAKRISFAVRTENFPPQ